MVLVSEKLYPKERPEKGMSRRRWRVDYDLAYDGGGSRWSDYYRTRFGAKVSAWLNVRLRSWGGSAILFDTFRDEY